MCSVACSTQLATKTLNWTTQLRNGFWAAVQTQGNKTQEDKTQEDKTQDDKTKEDKTQEDQNFA